MLLHSNVLADAHSVSQNAMDFSVFLKDQNHKTDSANHRGTRTVVKLVLSAGLAIPVGQNAIKLTTEAPWKEVKEAARTGSRLVFKSSYIPDTLPPLNVPNTRFQRPIPIPWIEQQKHVEFFRSL